MSEIIFSKSILTKAFLDFIPPSIKNDLLENSSFLEEFDLVTDRILLIGNENNLFYRSSFLNAIRDIYSKKQSAEILDTRNHKWEIVYSTEDNCGSQILLFNDEQKLSLSEFDVLSSDKLQRLTSFDNHCKNYNLQGQVFDKWRQTLLERPFNDDEYDAFESEIQNSPHRRAQMIRNEFLEGKVQITTLIPNSRNYYDRLVGRYDGSDSIQDYCAINIKNIFKKNIIWKPFEGFLYSLLLSSHPSISETFNFDSISNGDLLKILDFINLNGDRFSQIGLIEMCLQDLNNHPEMEPIIIELINQVQEENLNQEESKFTILSNLFIFVDGELSRSQLFSETNPFYRRLASISQAALIFQQLSNTPIDIKNFSKWAYDSRASQFYMQSFADMRLEPRWAPDFVVGPQLKSYCMGRINFAAQKNKQKIKEGLLLSKLKKIEQDSIDYLDKAFSYFLPGPLEGGDPPQLVIPSEIKLEIEAQLQNNGVELSSFIGLVNLALLCHIESSYAELATNALKIGNHRLSNVSDKTQLIQILSGLASVAGATRSEILGDELKIIARLYRNDSQFALTLDEELRICLVAASSRNNINSWNVFIGDWITELAFEKNNGYDVRTLYSHLHCLCNIVPKLWVSCGRADAALRAYIGCLPNA